MEREHVPPIRKVFLAIDGSEHAEAATRVLCDLACLKGAQVAALAVSQDRQMPGRQALLTALEKTQDSLSECGIRVATNLLIGHPAESLIEAAEADQPDMIIMGAKGLRATLGIFLGGVVQQVVEYAKHPVLVVRAPYRGIRRVLVACDGSVHSQRAIEFVRRFWIDDDVEFFVTCVLPPLPTAEMMLQTWPPDVGLTSPIPNEELEKQLAHQAEEEECEAKEYLAKQKDILENDELAATPVLLRGDAVSEILAFAETQKIDLIVAGSRGLSPVKGWLLGSVSRRLVHYAACSVLIVRGE